MVGGWRYKAWEEVTRWERVVLGVAWVPPPVELNSRKEGCGITHLSPVTVPGDGLTLAADPSSRQLSCQESGLCRQPLSVS